MAASENGKQYTIGKGRLYFDKYAEGSKTGTGERYLGNSPAVTVSASVDTLDHIDADQGMNVKDDQVTISNDMAVAFDLDSIDIENVALWYGGDADKMTVAAATSVDEPDFVMTPGTWKQLGANEDMPTGTRDITNVTISTVTPPVAPATDPTVTAITGTDLTDNFEIDLELARIYMEPTSTLLSAEGVVLRVSYDQNAIEPTTVIGRGDEIRGALRFIADNPKGENKDQFWPYVKLTSNGDYALKGDSWQQMSFNAEVLKKDATTERAYVTTRG